jgi:hypothetical protein
VDLERWCGAAASGGGGGGGGRGNILGLSKWASWLPREPRTSTQGRVATPPRAVGVALGEDFFQIFCKRFRPMPLLSANFLLRVPLFPECCTRGRWLSPSVSLPRVSCAFRHSGKPLFPECNSSPSATLGEFLALGEFDFSRSAASPFHDAQTHARLRPFMDTTVRPVATAARRSSGE